MTDAPADGSNKPSVKSTEEKQSFTRQTRDTHTQHTRSVIFQISPLLIKSMHACVNARDSQSETSHPSAVVVNRQLKAKSGSSQKPRVLKATGSSKGCRASGPARPHRCRHRHRNASAHQQRHRRLRARLSAPAPSAAGSAAPPAARPASA